MKKHECGGIRTHDLCLRRAALYPAELRIQVLCMLWVEAVLVNSGTSDFRSLTQVVLHGQFLLKP